MEWGTLSCISEKDLLCKSEKNINNKQFSTAILELENPLFYKGENSN